jgi:hypothetical protein
MFSDWTDRDVLNDLKEVLSQPLNRSHSEPVSFSQHYATMAVSPTPFPFCSEWLSRLFGRSGCTPPA